jgi:threonyl-tRNA synthetase
MYHVDIKLFNTLLDTLTSLLVDNELDEFASIAKDIEMLRASMAHISEGVEIIDVNIEALQDKIEEHNLAIVNAQTAIAKREVLEQESANRERGGAPISVEDLATKLSQQQGGVLHG